MGVALLASASPAVAQRPEAIARSAARAAAIDSVEARLHRLERSIDSLMQLSRSDELTSDSRSRVRQKIDETFFEYARLRASIAGPREGDVFIRQPDVFIRRPDVSVGVPADVDAVTRGFGVTFPRLAQTAMAPGWIGIVVSGAPTEVRIENNEMFLRYLTYPEIASVDPSSPAQRAGLYPGDTLMAYNGRDVRRDEISMTKLLRPKATVHVRVRRDGKEKELPVVVAEAPPRIKLRRNAEMGDPGAPWVAVAPSAPMLPRTAFAPPPPRRPALPSRDDGPVVARTPRMPIAPGFELAPSGIAGAQMTTVSEAMKRSWNLPAGVLVTMVPAGSPAAESGLEDGDVILRANQRPVARFNDLREQIARAWDEGERSVTLEVRRGKQRRTVTLRW